MPRLKILDDANDYEAFERILLEPVECSSLPKRSPNALPKNIRTQLEAPQRLASRLAEVAKNRS